MKNLITIITVVICSFSFSANSSTTLNLVCDLQEFHSKNNFFSKKFGDEFANGRTFFQLEFNEYSALLKLI